MNSALEKVPPCTGCKGRKKIFSKEANKTIRCPHCTGIGTMEAQYLVRELTGVEKRRVEQASRKIQAAVQEAILEHRNPATITEPTQRAVDRIMQRWAQGHGSGMAPDDAGTLPARLDPLDDVTQCIIDDIVNHAPDHSRSIIVDWYRRDTPVESMARARLMSKRTLYYHWHVILGWLEVMFRATKHPDLLRMLKLVQV